MTDRPVPGFATSDWAGDSATRWARHADALEAQLEPVADLLLDAAGLAPGDRVLDVGCGRGVTTRRAAAAVAPTGVATGVDIAAALLAEAAAASTSIPNVRWLEADAQRHDFAAGELDALISRFGVMFFDDATAAFTNLRRALRPGGRMTVVVWQPRDRSPLFEIPLAIARRRAADIGLDPDAAVVPVDGGPFSFGVADRTRAVLAAAGWSQIEQVPHVLDLYSGGPGAVDVAADVALEVGPIRALLDGATPDQREQMRAGLVEGLAEHHDGAGVRLAGAVVVVRGIA